MSRNDQNFTSGQIFNPKLKYGTRGLLTTNFDGASAKIYTCFTRKTAFVMQNIRNLGASGGEVEFV